MRARGREVGARARPRARSPGRGWLRGFAGRCVRLEATGPKGAGVSFSRSPAQVGSEITRHSAYRVPDVALPAHGLTSARGWTFRTWGQGMLTNGPCKSSFTGALS